MCQGKYEVLMMQLRDTERQRAEDKATLAGQHSHEKERIVKYLRDVDETLGAEVAKMLKTAPDGTPRFKGTGSPKARTFS